MTGNHYNLAYSAKFIFPSQANWQPNNEAKVSKRYRIEK